MKTNVETEEPIESNDNFIDHPRSQVVYNFEGVCVYMCVRVCVCACMSVLR